MKTLIAISLIALSSVIGAGTDWQAEPLESAGELRGTISWIRQDGMLVEGAFRRRTMGDSIFPGPFFLMGFTSKEAADGMGINVKALPAGTYTYTTVLGGSRTVKALRYSDE